MIDFLKQLAVYYGPRVEKMKKAVDKELSYGKYVFIRKDNLERTKSFYDLEFDLQDELGKYSKEELIAKRIKLFKQDFIKSGIKSDKDIIIYKYAKEDFKRIKEVIYNSNIQNKDEYIKKIKRNILYRLNNIHEYIAVTRYKNYYYNKYDLDFYKVVIGYYKVVYCVHNNTKIIVGIYYKRKPTNDYISLVAHNQTKRITRLRMKEDRIYIKDYCRLITLLYLESLTENFEKDRDEYLKKHTVRKYNTDSYVLREIKIVKEKKVTKKEETRRKRLIKMKKKEIYEYYKNHIMER